MADSVTPNLIMLVGIPGSGKTRWLIKNQGTATTVSPDHIRRSISGSISDQSANIEVWANAKRHAIACLANAQDIILDATNVNTVFRRQFLENLPPCNLIAVTFDVKPETACKRIRKDMDEGLDRSDVPDYVVYRMYGDFLYTKKVLKSEGFKVIKSTNTKGRLGCQRVK